MAFVGAFLGGSPKAMIPAGKSLLTLQWQAEDRADIQGASFTVTGPGVNKTVQAGADGRATLTVPTGSYTVSVTHTGTYNGDEPLTVKAESQTAYLVAFYGFIDQTAKFQGQIDAINNALPGKLDKDGTANRAYRDEYGNNIYNHYATKSELNQLVDSRADILNLRVSGSNFGYDDPDYGPVYVGTIEGIYWDPRNITSRVTGRIEAQTGTKTWSQYMSSSDLISGHYSPSGWNNGDEGEDAATSQDLKYYCRLILSTGSAYNAKMPAYEKH